MFLILFVGLHDKSICVGDIRASNIVFGEDMSCLIDFDFAGKCGKKLYPEGYHVKIEDGARHKDAVEGKTLQNLHDCFAFAAVMRLHACDDEKWTQAIGNLEKGNADQCAELLEEIHDLALDQESEERGRTGTGSPPRKKGNKEKK